MRNTFIDELTKITSLKTNTMLLVGDLGFSVVENFCKKHPRNFINAGIAEQNMSGIAAGLASEGYRVFTYSIGNFNTFRCAEQIRNDIDYHNFAVTIVSVGGGLSYGSLGYSHHLIQDYALMRSFPNMTLYTPTTSNQVKQCLKQIIKSKSPSYLRLGRTNIITKENDNYERKFRPGGWYLMKKSKNKNSKKCIVVTGDVLDDALNMIKKKKYQDYHIFSVPVWGMKLKKTQENEIKKWDEIITLEDHLEDGGFGSYILECSNSCKKFHTKIKIKSLDKKICGLVGSQEDIKKITRFAH